MVDRFDTVHIELTPAELRRIADLVEERAKRCNIGETRVAYTLEGNRTVVQFLFPNGYEGIE